MTHEDYRELLAAKALSALDAADARALHTHLEGCADCQSEMVELADTATLLAFQTEPLEPSTNVRERILASVRDEVRAEFRSDRVSPEVSQRDGNLLAFERPAPFFVIVLRPPPNLYEYILQNVFCFFAAIQYTDEQAK